MNNSSQKQLEYIKETYDSSKKLAQEVWMDGDYDGNSSDFYYFQCGFVAGMNYKQRATSKLQKKRLDALQKLSDLDQELGLH
jgi:hypothetical protein